MKKKLKKKKGLKSIIGFKVEDIQDYLKCHTGTIPIFNLEPNNISFSNRKISISGGGYTRKVVIPKESLLLDVGIDYSIMQFKGLKGEASYILEKIGQPTIKIEWRDYGVPDLSTGDWNKILKAIQKEGRNVVVACVGGHGRTGTTLAILAGLFGATKTDPVSWVRKRYCVKAVENIDQEEYVEIITGIPVVKTLPPKPKYILSEFYGEDYPNGKRKGFWGKKDDHKL